MRGACFLGKPNRSIFFILPNSGLQGGGKDPTSFLLDLCRFLPITKSHQVSHKKIPYLHVIKLVAIISYIKSTVLCKCSSVKFAFWLIFCPSINDREDGIIMFDKQHLVIQPQKANKSFTKTHQNNSLFKQMLKF